MRLAVARRCVVAAGVLSAALAPAPAAARPVHAARRTPAGELDPRIQKLVASISEERLQAAADRSSSSFRTRNTLSDPDLPNGIGAARQWILDEMKRSQPEAAGQLRHPH